MEGESADGVELPTLTEEMLEHLVEATRALANASPSDPFEEVVARIIVDAAQAVKADRAAIWFQRDDAIEVVATTGMRATTVDRFQHVAVAPDTPGETILRRRTPVTWVTQAQAQRYFPEVTVADFGSGYVTPLQTGERFSGVLFLGWNEQHRTVEIAERTFLEGVAHCCAIAAERSGVDEDIHVGVEDEIVAVTDAFSVRLTSSAGQSIARIAGEIDCANETDFERAVTAVVNAHVPGRLGLDLANVEFLSVAAARVILTACEGPVGHTDIYLLNSSPAARRVLDLLASDVDI